MTCLASISGRRTAAGFRVFSGTTFSESPESGLFEGEARHPSTQSASYFQYRYPSPRRSVRNNSNRPPIRPIRKQTDADTATNFAFVLAYQTQKTPLRAQARHALSIRGKRICKRKPHSQYWQQSLAFRPAVKAAILTAPSLAGWPDVLQAKSLATASACQAPQLAQPLALWPTTSKKPGQTAPRLKSKRTAPASAGAVLFVLPRRQRKERSCSRKS